MKLLHERLAPDSDAVARLRDEGRLLAMVDHPAILGVRDMLVLDGRIALVTEYIDGQDLTACIRDPSDRLPVRVLLEIVGVVADALHAARTAPGRDGQPLRIVHRDIKPSNIRISRHGSVKLLDFGIARSDAAPREAATATDTILGSLPYMAPERFDSNNTDPASDVYALGCVLYEGLTGRVLFDQPLPVMVGIAHAPDRHATQVAKRLDGLAGAPPEVVALLAAMIGHAPAGRPTAREVADRCDALAQATVGPNLRAWARERAWPEGAKVDAQLAGRVLTEGFGTVRSVPDEAITVAAATLPLGVEAPSGRGWAAVVGAVVSLGVGGVALAGVVAVAAAAVAFGGFGRLAPPETEVRSPGAAAVEAAPTVAVGSPDVEAPPAEATAPSLVPAVAPPTKVRSAPAAPPAAEVPAPRTTARVHSSGAYPITLRGPGGAWPLGEVPPGTYEVWATFPPEPAVHAADLTVATGDDRFLQCNPVRGECWVPK